MRVLSRILKFIVTGSFTVLLAACYGTVQVMYGVPFSPLRIRVVSENDPDTGISDLKVTLLENSQLIAYDTTNETGWAELEYYGMIIGALSVKVEDIDGPANGEYRDTEISLDDRDTERTIALDEK